MLPPYTLNNIKHEISQSDHFEIRASDLKMLETKRVGKGSFKL
mgnify:CR=1 FL=1